METQRQPKDSNWYNNRLVLILMFLALYVITFSTFIFVLVVIAPICYLLINIAEIITRKVLARNLIKTVIADEIRKRIKDVDALRLKEALCSNDVKTAIEGLNEETTDDDAKTAIINALNCVFGNNDAIVSLLKTESIKAEIASAIVSARKNEKKADKIIKKVAKDYRIDKILSSALKNETVKSSIENALGSDLKDAITSSLKTNAMNVNDLRTEISASLKNDEGKIKDAIAAVFKDVDINETISAALGEKEVKDELQKKLNEQERIIVKNAVNDILSDKEVNSAIEKALQKDVLAILDKGIQSQINKCVKDAINNENEAQKYRLVERVVEEICKGNKSSSIDIDDLRALIGSILNDDKGCCVTDVSSKEDEVIFTMRDIKCNTFKITIDYKKSTINSNKKTGTYYLSNGLVVKLNNHTVEDVKRL